MVTFVLRRLLYSVPVLALSSFLSFVFVSEAGDPLSNLRQNPRVTNGTLQSLAHTYHLDQSVVVRYWYWLESAFTQKLGVSLITSQPIWPDLQRSMAHTLQIIMIANFLALLLGIAVGIYSAVRQYSFFDYSFTALSFVGLAMPTFWLALLLQILFVDIYLRWHVRIFYTSGLNTHGDSTWSLDRLQHITLPVITLTVVSFALYSRFMRASMLDVINSDFVRTARAKGLGETKVIMRHVVRNALIPVVTITALNFGALLGGAIVTETVFTLDGMGFYFIQKLGQQDVYAVMGYLVVTSMAIILFNLLADVLYGYLDPRIRLD